MREVAHRRHKAIRERRHVPHIRLVRRLRHRPRVRRVHRQRLLAKHVLAVRDRPQRDRWMENIRRRDDHRIHIVARHDLLPLRGSDSDARRARGLFQRRRIRVAQRHDLRFRAKREPGEMILQRNSAATDDGNAQCFHNF
jgi:hypothetical protein